MSYRRVQKFLALEESNYHVEPVVDPGTAIQVQDATFQWAAEETQQLTHIDFSVRKGGFRPLGWRKAKQGACCPQGRISVALVRRHASLDGLLSEGQTDLCPQNSTERSF